MSHFMSSTGAHDEVVAEYIPAEPEEAFSAYVRVRLTGGSGSATMFLDIEHVRVLTQVLPDLLMSHDAAQRVAREQAAAIAEAA